ncbi:Peptide transporter PTR2 [Madurella fahalii]|uniref:Peptide transporter PTR2 n=1 Tax=Madurella fahalii TaxID=1157608 RepID=A0ABQ0GN89_9PEZI
MVQVELVDGFHIWSRYARSSVPPELEGIAFPRYGEPIEGLAYSVLTVTEQTFPDRTTAPTPILLAADGCAYDDGPRNCSRVCNDPAAMFSSWYSLWNCFTLTAMAVYVQNASLATPSVTGLQVANGHLGFGDLETFNASSVIDSVITCGLRAAYDGMLGYIPDAKGVSIAGGATPLENLTFFWTLPCFHVQSDLNSDIAGAGMLVAYFIQGFLAAYGWALCGLLTGVPLALSAVIHLLPRVTRNRSTSSSLLVLAGRVESWAIRIDRSRAGAALKTMLVDHQETQCFFTIGAQVALTYAASQPASFRGEQTYQQLMNNQAFMRVMGVMSLYSVTLAQLALRRAGMNSAYTLVFSVAAVTSKIISDASIVTPGPEQLWSDFYGQNRVDECGANSSPRTFCYVKVNPVEYLDQMTYSMNQVLPPAIAAFALLLIDKIPARVWTALGPSAHGPYRRLQTITRVGPQIMEALYWGLELFFFFMVCHGLDFFQSKVKDTVIRNSDESNAAGDFAERGLLRFTVGQVVAVMTWTPVMARYLYTTAFGFEHTSKIRIAAPFEIVKKRREETPISSPGKSGDITELGKGADCWHGVCTRPYDRDA